MIFNFSLTPIIHVLEAFNGQYFFNLPDTKSQIRGASVGMSAAANNDEWRLVA